MTDIRARLAEAIGLHQYVGPGRCNRCDWVGGDRYDHDLHRADVLLSLPGIAIVTETTIPFAAHLMWASEREGDFDDANAEQKSRYLNLARVGLFCRSPRRRSQRRREGGDTMSEPRPLGGLEGER